MNSLIKTVLFFTFKPSEHRCKPRVSSGYKASQSSLAGVSLEKVGPTPVLVFGLDIQMQSCQKVCSVAQRPHFRLKRRWQTRVLKIIKETEQDMVAHTFNPRWISGVQGQAGLYSKFQESQRYLVRSSVKQN